MKIRNQAYLLLGSNLGDRLMNIHQAMMDIHLLADDIIAISDIYETSPWGVDGQQHYLNVVMQIATRYYPFGLMFQLQKIEKEMGRVNKGDMLPRRMDIDILLFEDLQLVSEKLILPHPRLHLRKFVLEPLSDIAPDLMIPGKNKSVKELLEECSDQGTVVRYREMKNAL